MKYDEALKAWGAAKLAEKYIGAEIDPDSVKVDIETYSGGYCETCEYTSVEVTISGRAGTYLEVSIDKWSFSFADMLKEVCEAANGAVTLD